MTSTRRTLPGALTATPFLGSVPARAEADTIRIAIQPGLTYLVLNVMQHQKLIEKTAAGLPTAKAEFI